MRIAVWAIVVLLPMQALALSCLPWYVEDAYNRAADSPDPYIVVHGTLEFDEDALPIVDFSRQDETPPETRIQARVRGDALTGSGFDHAVDASASLVVKCFGPWCSSAKPKAMSLMFLKRTDAGLLVETDPCATMLFQNPTKEDVRRVLRCHRGGKCTPPVQ